MICGGGHATSLTYLDLHATCHAGDIGDRMTELMILRAACCDHGECGMWCGRLGYPPKVLTEDLVCEGHHPSLPGEAGVGLVGDLGELGHHEPGAVAHGLGLL